MINLKNIINNRPVFILLHGGSVQNLEDRIEEFKDANICWCGLGHFQIFEKYMLSKIDKRLDLVFDMATVPRREAYEPVRHERLNEFLGRSDNNLWLTSHGMIRDEWDKVKPEKCLLVDSLFPQDQIPYYMDVPNSATLCIASMLAGGASKIFIFGLDGYKGSLQEGYKSYYKPEEAKKERLLALGSIEDPGINRDTDNFSIRFPTCLRRYRELFGNYCDIYNCSPNSIYTCIEKIDYSKIKNIL